MSRRKKGAPVVITRKDKRLNKTGHLAAFVLTGGTSAVYTAAKAATNAGYNARTRKLVAAADEPAEAPPAKAPPGPTLEQRRELKHAMQAQDAQEAEDLRAAYEAAKAVPGGDKAFYKAYKAELKARKEAREAELRAEQAARAAEFRADHVPSSKEYQARHRS